METVLFSSVLALAFALSLGLGFGVLELLFRTLMPVKSEHPIHALSRRKSVAYR